MNIKEVPTPNPTVPAEQVSGEEVPFQPTDSFWTDTTFHGSDTQLAANVALHVGHEVAHEAKKEIKGLLKGLLGFR